MSRPQFERFLRNLTYHKLPWYWYCFRGRVRSGGKDRFWCAACKSVSRTCSTSTLFSLLSQVKLPCKNVSRYENDVTAFGLSKVRTLNVHEVLALEPLLGEAVNVSTVNTFERVLLHGTVMHTANYYA